MYLKIVANHEHIWHGIRSCIKSGMANAWFISCKICILGMQKNPGFQQAMTLCVPPPLPFIPGQHQQTFAAPQINNPSTLAQAPAPSPSPSPGAPAPALAMALPPPIPPMQLQQSVVSSSGVSHEGQRR